MAVDWRLLTDSSANFGNALVGAAGNVRQHRETARNREAVANYLANPNDRERFQALAGRNPEMAFRIEDQHLQRVRQMRSDQQQQVQFLGRILRGVRDEAGYRGALDLARQAGIDISGHETYNPKFVEQIQELDRALNAGEGYTLGRGDIRYDSNGREIARGAAPPAQVVPIAPGGRAAVFNQEWPEASARGTASATVPSASAAPVDEAPAFHPQYEPTPADNIVYVTSPAQAAALPPGTRFMVVGETEVRTRR